MRKNVTIQIAFVSTTDGANQIGTAQTENGGLTMLDKIIKGLECCKAKISTMIMMRAIDALTAEEQAVKRE